MKRLSILDRIRILEAGFLFLPLPERIIKLWIKELRSIRKEIEKNK